MNELEDEQTTFRRIRQTNDNTAIVKTLIEGTVHSGGSLHSEFTDLRATFDTTKNKLRDKVYMV